uniref:Beta-catenin-like protein 1 N-terminal domain-containing protein n=1 Tax=Dunaliella tertiolecta TaxID=3047 RepID=A0A7S3R3A3_DUNTE|mmetsp:Transcript_28265/g.76335  ORF Transcript_28265/g.76335 Transcript_28265/m.76335 type:complete len:863 (+) Transcript_28265:131-2719(+)
MASQHASEWHLQAAINAAAGLADVASQATFQPSRTFQGSRPGFFFTAGPQGLGYYLDEKQADEGKAEEPEPEQVKQLDPEELLKQAEEDAHIDQIQLLDAKGLKRIVTALEKKYKENLEQRMKYAEAPEKFLDSEVDLDEQVKSLLQVAGSPDLYPLLVELNPFPTLLSCLSHENTDIAGDTVELLMELTDADVLQEHEEEARSLVAALLENNVLELLVQRLTSFNEKVEEEAKAVFNCLNTFENMVETDPSVAEQVVEKTRLMKWLLGRIRPREFDSNKQQASELLAVLVQGSEKNQKKLGELNGIDVLLQCVALYKGRDPGTAEEEEFMQDCFDVLCSAMMLPENKQAFVKAEGVELMWLMLANKRQSRFGALKLLDYAATRYGAPCEKLVDLGGLKHLFGAFMGKAKIRGPTGERDVEQEVEERCISLVASLFTNLGPKGGRRERVGAKFVENEFEKADRLLEIYFRYYDRVAAQEALIERRLNEEKEEEEEDEDEVTPEQIWMERMEAGLFTLHQASLVLAHIWGLGDTGLRKRILGVLHQRSHSLAHVRAALLEYYGSIGDDGQPEDVARLRSRAREALIAVGATPEELEQQQQQQQQQPQRGAKGEEPAGDGGEVRHAGKASKLEASNAALRERKDKTGDAVDMDADMDVAMEVEEGEAPEPAQVKREQPEERESKQKVEEEKRDKEGDTRARESKREKEKDREQRHRTKEKEKDRGARDRPEKEDEDGRRDRKDRERRREREREREEDRKAEIKAEEEEEAERERAARKKEERAARESRELEEDRAAAKEAKERERRAKKEEDRTKSRGEERDGKRGREEGGRDRDERKERKREKESGKEKERHSHKRSRRSRSP